MDKYNITKQQKLIDLFNLENGLLPKLMSPDKYEGQSRINKNDFNPKSLILPNLSKFKCLYCLRELKDINPKFKDNKFCELKRFEIGIKKECPICSKSYKQDNHHFYKHIHKCRMKYPTKWNDFDRQNHNVGWAHYDFRYIKDMNNYLHNIHIKELYIQRKYNLDLIYEFEKVLKQTPITQDLLIEFNDEYLRRQQMPPKFNDEFLTKQINTTNVDYYTIDSNHRYDILNLYKKLKNNVITIDLLLYKISKTAFPIQNYMRIFGTSRSKNVFINLFGFKNGYEYSDKYHSMSSNVSIRIDLCHKKKVIKQILGKIRTVTDMTVLFRSFLYVLLPNIDEKNILDIITSYWSHPINYYVSPF